MITIDFRFLMFLNVLFFFSCSKKRKEQKNVVEKPKMETLNNKINPITNDLVIGKFNYRTDTSFIVLADSYSNKKVYLKKEVAKAFKRMHDSALKDDVVLKVISGTRNFEEQKWIWNRKWKKYEYLSKIDRVKEIMKYSAMPTTSRHHWGTDVDINSVENDYFEKGKGRQEYDWLVMNANRFGFYQVYDAHENRGGYELEKWHWSYLSLASKYLLYYNENITYKTISGFKGAKYADSLNVIEDHVNGVANDVKNYED